MGGNLKPHLAINDNSNNEKQLQFMQQFTMSRSDLPILDEDPNMTEK